MLSKSPATGLLIPSGDTDADHIFSQGTMCSLRGRAESLEGGGEAR